MDRKAFAETYHLPFEKVLAVENGVDVDYFYAMDAGTDYKIVFVGNMGYSPTGV